MPTIPINQESPSVFDSLFEQVMKRMKPSAPDVSDIGGLMGPIGVAAPLVAKLPLSQKQYFIDLLRKSIPKDAPKELLEAVDFATKHRPRVLSHVLSIEPLEILHDSSGIPQPGMLGKMVDFNPKEVQGFTSKIEISPKSVKKFKTGTDDSRFAEDIAETFGHELTHAGQATWQGNKFGPKYNQAEGAVGYWDNPFEKGARTGGKNFMERMFYPAARKKLTKTPQEWGLGSSSSSIVNDFLTQLKLIK